MKRLKVLCACEESQAVCKEFRRLGHEAFSCDIQPCSGGHPEWHLQQDVIPLLKENWDLIIAFPPCTHLCNSGQRWFTEGKKSYNLQRKAISFFYKFVIADCPHIAIENPVGIMSTAYRKPDQIINPWQFGSTECKNTCLWLKNLPLLKPTEIIPAENRTHELFKGYGYSWNDPITSTLRSKTFPGIAKAMAEQWSEYLCLDTL